MILSTAYFDSEELESASLIDLYELKIKGVYPEQVFRFHSGARNTKKTENISDQTSDKDSLKDSPSESLFWRGLEYFYFPVSAKGFENSGTGKLPRPRLKISNVTHLLPSFLEAYEDFLGSEFKRIRVYDRFLDASNNKNDQQSNSQQNQQKEDYSQWNSLLFFPQERYIVERKIEETPLYVEFELASPLDAQGVDLPRRKILQRYCNWEYKKFGECGYPGRKYFDLKDNSVSDVNLDRCAKKLSSCQKRFAPHALRFGGFPSITT